MHGSTRIADLTVRQVVGALVTIALVVGVTLMIVHGAQNEQRASQQLNCAVNAPLSAYATTTSPCGR